MLKNFKELKVWQKAYDLCVEEQNLLLEKISEAERMLKALMKSLKNRS